MFRLQCSAFLPSGGWFVLQLPSRYTVSCTRIYAQNPALRRVFYFYHPHQPDKTPFYGNGLVIMAMASPYEKNR